jgi:hypothetical protein
MSTGRIMQLPSHSSANDSLLGSYILSCELLDFNRYIVELTKRLASWHPDLPEIEDLAGLIYTKWAATDVAEAAKAKNDKWSAHDAYSIRDVLLFCEFEQAVSFGDPARVPRMFHYWCLSFHRAGQHSYARECAEILLRWKY